MRKSLIIKVPALALVALSLALLPAPAAWIGAGLAIAAGVVGLAIDVNSSFWAPTLWRAPLPTNAVALTFDDGPDPEFTPRMLQILAEGAWTPWTRTPSGSCAGSSRE